SLLLLFAFVLGGSVHGFADIAADQGKAEIMALKESHLISGIGGNKFGPNQKLTNAQGVVMIIKGLNLNIDHLRFIKQPLASDYYTNIDDDAWYAHALIVAQYAGLDLPKDIDPHAVMTKEAFTHYLFQGIMQTGNYAFIELVININDSDDINKDY